MSFRVDPVTGLLVPEQVIFEVPARADIDDAMIERLDSGSPFASRDAKDYGRVCIDPFANEIVGKANVAPLRGVSSTYALAADN